jgi:hypothetical protein
MPAAVDTLLKLICAWARGAAMQSAATRASAGSRNQPATDLDVDIITMIPSEKNDGR